MKDYLYFIAVAEEQSFSKAAKRLFMAQSSLSQAIKALEEELNVQLFERLPRGVKLTKPGQLVLEKAYEIQELEKSIYLDMNRFQQTFVGELTIGITNYWATLLLPKILNPFMAQYPNIRINVREASTRDLKKAFSTKQMDCILITCEAEELLNEERLVQTKIFEEPLKIAVSQSLLRWDQDQLLNQRRLVAVPFIVLHEGQRLRTIFQEYFAQSGAYPAIFLETQSVFTAYELASAGFGATIIPQHLLSMVKPNPSLSLYGFEHLSQPFIWRLYGLVYKKHHLREPIETFFSLAQAALEEREGKGTNCFQMDE